MATESSLILFSSPSMGRVLHPLLQFATIAALYFHLREFWSLDYVLRYNPDAAYITLLAAYAGHREVRRWNQDPALVEERAKRGELFVAGWWTFYFAALIAANHVAHYRLPDSLFSLCAQITGIFFATLTSQQLFTRKDVKREVSDGGPQTTDERVLEHIRKITRPIKRAEIQIALGVSQPTLSRSLKRLEAQKKIAWSGKSDRDPAGCYTAVA